MYETEFVNKYNAAIEQRKKNKQKAYDKYQAQKNAEYFQDIDSVKNSQAKLRPMQTISAIPKNF